MENHFHMKKNFGFGCMRLPMIGEEVDHAHFSDMVDAFMEAGFNYFDTAHGYINGKSETAIRECLVSRYPRESYILTNKLSVNYFEKQEDIRPVFESQLKACGVEYFDFYLMHAQDRNVFPKYKKCRAYETALELLAEGKIKHLGISFHDTADVLEQILSEYPQIEMVMIQFNYLDYEDPSIQSRKVYEVCRKFDKAVVVMEPVKGGKLIELPPSAQAVFDELQGGSNASYAIRFAASFEGVVMVISGMGNMDMVRDNIGYMQDFIPLSAAESVAVEKVGDILCAQDLIPCTDCKYCVEGCPSEILIPALFACMNDRKTSRSCTDTERSYSAHTENRGKASDCVECGQCEEICPQHLPIRHLLRGVAETFEK